MKTFMDLDYKKKCLLVSRVSDMYFVKNMYIFEIAEELGEPYELIHEVFEIVMTAITTGHNASK